MERTVLQDFAEGIAAEVSGVPKGTVCAGVDAGAVEWVVIIQMIMEMVMQFIDKCQQPQDALLASIRKPSFFQRVRFRMQVRNVCSDCSRQQWRSKSSEIADALLNAGKTQEDTVVLQIIEECRKD